MSLIAIYLPQLHRPDQTSYLYFMSFAASVLEHTVEAAEVFVSIFFLILQDFSPGFCPLQDNTGALLQDEEFLITDNGRSGMVGLTVPSIRDGIVIIRSHS